MTLLDQVKLLYDMVVINFIVFGILGEGWFVIYLYSYEYHINDMKQLSPDMVTDNDWSVAKLSLKVNLSSYHKMYFQTYVYTIYWDIPDVIQSN